MRPIRTIGAILMVVVGAAARGQSCTSLGYSVGATGTSLSFNAASTTMTSSLYQTAAQSTNLTLSGFPTGSHSLRAVASSVTVSDTIEAQAAKNGSSAGSWVDLTTTVKTLQSTTFDAGGTWQGTINFRFDATVNSAVNASGSPTITVWFDNTCIITTVSMTWTVGQLLGITRSSSSTAFLINTATAGSPPTTDTHTAGTYCVYTNVASSTITGQINSNMPSGATFTLTLDAPTGANSSAQTITTSPANLVTSIPAGTAACAGVVHYSLSATSALGVVSGSKTLTLTLTTGGGA
jgi:hypothetical protein